MEELIDAFDLSRVNKSGAVFDRSKLNWMNAHYIKALPINRLVDYLTPFLVEAGLLRSDEKEVKQNWLIKIGELLRDRIEYFAQAPQELAVILNSDIVITDPKPWLCYRKNRPNVCLRPWS